MLSTKLKEAAGNGADATLYVDDVFSTYLYTGNSTARSITNGIDLSTNGGMVWFKSRNLGGNHYQVDTARGNTKYLASNSTTSQMTFTDALTAFNTTGFNLGVDAAAGDINGTGYNMASWTFRKAAKFFDVVTYTGNGVAGRSIAHSLQSTPAIIFIKATNNTSSWFALCRKSDGNYARGESSYNFALNTTEPAENYSGSSYQSNASVFYPSDVRPDANNETNANGYTYVAYLFAHDTDADGIIQCGSVAVGETVNLGWEPQYLLMKRIDAAGNWYIDDVMRGLPAAPTNDTPLLANTSAAEPTGYAGIANITATGFTFNANGTIIYMAIRRPNKPPTSGTQVFSPQIWTGNATARTITGTNNPVDLSIVTVRDNGGSGGDRLWNDRLRGAYQTLYSNYTQAEATQSNYITGFDVQYGEKIGTAASVNGSSITYVAEMFSRAPGFFDVVCWTADATYALQNHNLTVVPELVIQKQRNGTSNWFVFNGTSIGYLELTDAFFSLSTTLTSTTFRPVSTGAGNTYVAYLFATLAGISKVGSYTGNGSSQNINCGFAAGARFIMIKATSTTGNWIVFDSARGIVAGNDPFFYMNNQDAETTNQDAIDPYSAGFTVNTTNVNDSGVSYIFLAVA